MKTVSIEEKVVFFLIVKMLNLENWTIFLLILELIR